MQNSQKDFYKKLLGRDGESLAVKFLKKRGHKILKRNYKCDFGEADIISRDKNGIYVFTEVKTRNGEFFGRPLDSITVAKQNKYRKLAEFFMVNHNLFGKTGRFDVIEVEGKEINYIENAF